MPSTNREKGPDMKEAVMGMGIVIAAYTGWQLLMLPSQLNFAGVGWNGRFSASSIIRAVMGAVSAAALFLIIGQQVADLGAAATVITAVVSGALGAAFACGVRRLGQRPAAQQDQ